MKLLFPSLHGCATPLRALRDLQEPQEASKAQSCQAHSSPAAALNHSQRRISNKRRRIWGGWSHQRASFRPAQCEFVLSSAACALSLTHVCLPSLRASQTRGSTAVCLPLLASQTLRAALQPFASRCQRRGSPSSPASQTQGSQAQPFAFLS